MKKIIILAALLIAGLSVPELANSSNTDIESIASSIVTRTVKAWRNPGSGAKVYHYLTVTWDGDECWVIQHSHKDLPEPIRAYYDTTYRGYPFRAKINGNTYYFNLD